MASSTGLFSQSTPKRENLSMSGGSEKKLQESKEDKNAEGLLDYYQSLNHYEQLMTLRKSLCAYHKEVKSKAPPTSIRQINWLISWTGIPVNQGDAENAFKIIDAAFNVFAQHGKEKFIKEAIPKALKDLLKLYKLIVTTGRVSKAIDAVFVSFLRVKANDLDETKLDALIEKLSLATISQASKLFPEDHPLDESTLTEVYREPDLPPANFFGFGLGCAR